MKAHKYAEFFDLLPDDQLQEMAADIKARGLRQKIITLDGKILDGRNREKACRIAGVEPIYKEYTGKDPLGYVKSQNVYRRHLSPKERAALGALELEDKKKAPSGAALTQAAVAKKVGVSRRTIQRAVAKTKPKKEKEPGFSKEQLVKDQELADHFDMIESVYGAADTKAIRTGTVPMTRADVLFLGKLPKDTMIKIQDLLFTTTWSPKKCVEFLNSEPDDDSTVADLKHLCLATKGKYWTGDLDGYAITVKYNRAAKR